MTLYNFIGLLSVPFYILQIVKQLQFVLQYDNPVVNSQIVTKGSSFPSYVSKNSFGCNV